MSAISLMITSPALGTPVSMSLSLELTVGEATALIARILARKYPALFTPTGDEMLVLLEEDSFESASAAELASAVLNPKEILGTLLATHVIEENSRIALV